MTAQERKENTEKLFEEHGLPPLQYELPPMEEDAEINVRSGDEIARRLLVLGYLNCVAVQPDLNEQVIQFLIQENLWSLVSDRERVIFETTNLSEEDHDYVAWRNESIWLMLWAIMKIDALEFPADELNPGQLVRLIPQFFEPVGSFATQAVTRSKTEIMDQADLHFRLCWAVREHEQNASAVLPFVAGVAFERHFALEWIKNVRDEWE